MDGPDDLGLDPTTVAIAAGRGSLQAGAPLNVPVTLASVYHAGGAVDYGREANPTWSAFEEALGALEHGRALTFASGMGAVSAVLEHLPLGARVVVPADAYTGTRALLANRAALGRLLPRPVDISDTTAVLDACVGAQLLWIESPTNPMLVIADVAALAAGAHEAGAQVVVDNTFATPLNQQPLDLGADIVVHSVTKFIAGHSDVVLGALVVADEDLATALADQRTRYGAVPGPMETWLALRGLRTLPLRLEKAQTNAAELARRLEGHPRVTKVHYPGLASHPQHRRARTQMRRFGTMVSFQVDGGQRAAEAVCDRVRLLVHATSMGGVETTLERRNRHPGEEAVPADLIRLSVGCEHVEDLWDDLAGALSSVEALDG